MNESSTAQLYICIHLYFFRLWKRPATKRGLWRNWNFGRPKCCRPKSPRTTVGLVKKPAAAKKYTRCPKLEKGVFGQFGPLHCANTNKTSNQLSAKWTLNTTTFLITFEANVANKTRQTKNLHHWTIMWSVQFNIRKSTYLGTQCSEIAVFAVWGGSKLTRNLSISSSPQQPPDLPISSKAQKLNLD